MKNQNIHFSLNINATCIAEAARIKQEAGMFHLKPLETISQ